jgi:phospholipase A1/A2
MNIKQLFFLMVSCCLALFTNAETPFETCLTKEVLLAAQETTAAEMRKRCQERVKISSAKSESKIGQRLLREGASSDNPHVITPHRRNYILPYTYSEEPNEEPFRDFLGVVQPEDSLDNEEVKYQLSLKVPLVRDLLLKDDAVYFGFTISSYWQLYNNNISAAFRETNYEPEFFWLAPVDWNPFDADANYLGVGFIHQSNGRNLPLSRSWNRIYVNFIWEEGPWAFGFKPWWRIPEDDKDDANDTSGDDNPDIDDYLGYFEFDSIYRHGQQEFGLMLRNNMRSDNHGAVQLDWSFPLWGRLRGYAQYFNGYGESMLDYNVRIERLGIGILLTDIL